jgi:ribonuclease HI
MEVIQGHVGTAAWCPNAGRAKSRYLGNNTQSTVYAAELAGIELALQIAQELEGCNRITIFTDNRAVRQAIINPKMTSGQYITSRAINEINRARRKGITPILHWIPSHTGVKGNEEVDVMAKEAAGWSQETKELHQGLRAEEYPTFTLWAAKKRAIKQRITEEWEKRWENGLHGREYFQYAPKPHKQYPGAHKNLAKALSSVIIQMRTGKIGLNSYCHGIGAITAPTDRCRGCKEERESLYHVLLYCPTYRKDRQKYWGRDPPRSLREIFADTEKSITAAKQLLSTGLLVQFSRTARKTLSTPTGR